jgi:hypothetical protein
MTDTQETPEPAAAVDPRLFAAEFLESVPPNVAKGIAKPRESKEP